MGKKKSIEKTNIEIKNIQMSYLYTESDKRDYLLAS